MGFPKILIVGQPFNSDSGGGITLSNLFRDWPKEKLAVACSGYLLNDGVDSDKCSTYYQLGHHEHKYIFPFKLIKRKYYSGIVRFNEKNTSKDITIPKPSLRAKIVTNIFDPLLHYTGMEHTISRLKISNTLNNWLSQYKPDIIYAQMTSLEDIRFCISLQSHLKIPLIYHMMDDWIMTISDSGPFKKYWFRTIDKYFRNLLSKSSLLLGISDYLAEEYKKRYNTNFITFHNPIDLDFWKAYQRDNYELSETPSVLYAGRTGLGIDSSLKTIAATIQSNNDQNSIRIKFVLQTETKPSWTKHYACVEYQHFVPYSELPRVFSRSDILILPYDFSDRSIRYIRYSMPTKAPEYMISGSPIIVFAPEETAIAKSAQKIGWAKVVTENVGPQLYNCLLDLISSRSERQNIAQIAKQYAENNYDSRTVTRKFKNIICSVLQMPKTPSTRA